MNDATPEFLRNLADRVVPPRQAERLRSIADRLEGGFIQLGGRYIRPEDVVMVAKLCSSGWGTTRAKLYMKGGHTIRMDMTPDEVREKLNG